MSSNFVHLHVHSHYSLLDGLSKIDELVAKTKEYNMSAIALTDHGVMYGILEFYKKAKGAGIKPILGCEVYIAPRTLLDKTPKIDTKPYHLVLLAKNMNGYKNLIKLVTEAHLKGYYYKPRIDKTLLQKYGSDLIGLTACLHGEIPRLILNNKYEEAKKACEFYQSIFGKEDYYLELQHHPSLPEQEIVNKGLIKLSKEMNIPLVATNDSHYLNSEDDKAHEVLLAVQTGKDLDDKDRLSMSEVDLSFLSPEKMRENFKEYPEALENTVKIAEKCNIDLKLGKIILPKFEVPGGIDSMMYLRKLCKQGLKERYPNADDNIKKRMEYELGVIEKMGFADYFLIVSDFVNWAKDQGIIVGPGRGSAAGAITAYVLKITDLNPLDYDLLFERFLNPDRISMPDIDIDFADDRRDEVIAYVKQKYGEDYVAQIITFGTMAARGSIRDTTRALGMGYESGDRIAKLIPFGKSIKESLTEVSELKNIYDTEKDIKHLIDMAKKLEGVARHASTHACGIVISKEPLTEYLPLQKSTRGEEGITTQYAMMDVDSIGLLKMDFLGLSNLTVIKNALRIVKKVRNEDIEIGKLKLDDTKTYELLARAETTGVFQLESDGMKRYLKDLKPSKFDDIIAMVALYRPGPIEFIPDYINGKNGKKKIVYIHPKLEPILKNTYGIVLYQEQVMRIATDMAGFTMGQADVLRKAVGKKIKKLLDQQKQKLIDGMVKNKIEKKTAERIWQFIEPFARYGFNKSHAACYALIAYQTAYLKAHYPSEFMAALLTSDFQNMDRVTIEISEAEKMGLKILPPNVNESFVEFGVIRENGNISFSLAAIKNVGVGVAEAIVNERTHNGKYKSIEDFISRLGSGVINKKSMESLARAGALDEVADRNQILFNMETILKFSASLHKQGANGQMGLFGQKTTENITALKLLDAEPISKKQKLSWEKELLGIYVSEHPLDDVKHILEKKAPPIFKLNSDSDGKKVKAAGIISAVQKIITRSGEPMLFIKLEDTTSQVEVLVFPKLLKQNNLIWQMDNIIIVEGKLNMKDGAPKILAETVHELGQQISLENSRVKDPCLIIQIPDNSTKIVLGKIKEILVNNPGQKSAKLRIKQGNEVKMIDTKLKINNDQKIKNELELVVGKENIIDSQVY